MVGSAVGSASRSSKTSAARRPTPKLSRMMDASAWRRPRSASRNARSLSMRQELSPTEFSVKLIFSAVVYGEEPFAGGQLCHG